MGRKEDRQYAALMAQLQAAINQAMQPSPIEQQMTADYGNLRNWLNQRDYRNLPSGTFIDQLPLAEMNKMRQMMRGSGKQAAQGVINPTIMQQQRSLDDDQFTQDWAGGYEQRIGDLMGRSTDMASYLQGLHGNRMQTGIQGAQGMLQALANKPQKKGFWSSFLSGGLQGASTMAAGGI